MVNKNVPKKWFEKESWLDYDAEEDPVTWVFRKW